MISFVRSSSSADPDRPRVKIKSAVSYLLVTWLITSAVLTQYAQLLFPLIPATNFYREFMICGGQIVFQGAVIAFLNRNRTLEYLVHMMTVSFAGALLLLIPLALQAYVTHPLIAAAYFAVLVFLMFIEHIRRMKNLGLPWVMTISWVIYRVMILGALLF